MEYQGARIQLLDLPGIVEGASQGRGRGRQVVASQLFWSSPWLFVIDCHLSRQDGRSHTDHA